MHSINIFFLSLLFIQTTPIPTPLEQIRGSDTPKLFKPGNSHIFQSHKRLIGSLVQTHVIFDFDAIKLRHAIDDTCACIHNIPNSNPNVKERITLFRSRCVNLYITFQQHVEMLTTTPNIPQKRFAATAAIGTISGISSLLGLYNLFAPGPEMVDVDEFKALSSKVDRHGLSLSKINEVLEEINSIQAENSAAAAALLRRIDSNAKLDLCSEKWEALETLINDATEIIFTAANGKISPKLFNPEDVTRLLRQLPAQLDQDDLDTPVNSPYLFYSLPASAAYSSNGTVQIAVHVPFYRRDTMLDLFRYIPTPILDHGRHVLITADETFLGISDNKAFYKILTEQEMLSCQINNDVVLCPGDNILHRREHSSCTSALYFNDIPAIQQLCQVAAVNLQHITVQLNKTDFLLLHPEAMQLEVTCTGNIRQPSLTSTFSGLRQLHLPAGCTGSTDLAVMTSEVSAHYHGKLLQRENNLTPQVMFNTTDSSLISTITRSIRETPTKISDLIKESEDMLKPWPAQTSPTSEISTAAAIIIISLIIIIILIITCCCLKKQRNRREQTRRFLNDVDNFRPDDRAVNNPALKAIAKHLHLPTDNFSLSQLLARLDRNANARQQPPAPYRIKPSFYTPAVWEGCNLRSRPQLTSPSHHGSTRIHIIILITILITITKLSDTHQDSISHLIYFYLSFTIYYLLSYHFYIFYLLLAFFPFHTFLIIVNQSR